MKLALKLGLVLILFAATGHAQLLDLTRQARGGGSLDLFLQGGTVNPRWGSLPDCQAPNDALQYDAVTTHDILCNPIVGPNFLTREAPNDTLVGTTTNTPSMIAHNNVNGGHSSVWSALTLNAGVNNDDFAGICYLNCGKTGNATLIVYGTASCVFDNAPTIGHVVGISATTNARCHDLGDADTEPGQSSWQTSLIGYALETHAVAGTYTMMVTPMASNQWTLDQKPILAGSHSPYFYGTPMVLDMNAQLIALTNSTPLRFYSGTHSNTRVGGLEVAATSPNQTLGIIQSQFYLDRTLNGQTSQAVLGAGTMNLDFNLGAKYARALTGNITDVTFTNQYDANGAGPIFPLKICQDSTGGRKLTWNTSNYWNNPPAIPAFPSGCINMFWYNNGSIGGRNFSLAGPATPLHPEAILGRSTSLTAVNLTHPMEEKLLRVNGNLTCIATSLTLTSVGVFGGITVYSYSGYTGAAPSVGETLVVTGFTNPGNNGTFVAAQVTSADFRVTTTTQVNEGAAASAATQSNTGGTADLVLLWTDRGGTSQSYTASVDCTTLGSASIADMVHIIRPQPDTDVQYKVDVTANTPNYDVDVSVETIQ